MTKKLTVELTANFERNLADIERFLKDANSPQAYDALLDELLATVIPNLERFPEMGRTFPSNPSGSVEATNFLKALSAKISTLTNDTGKLREYILANYLVLYVHFGDALYLLAIKHFRQISFDFKSHWGGSL